MTHVPLVVDGNASASSAYRAPFSSVFCSLLAGMFCAWTAPPDVLALAERLMTKPFGSRVSAMRIVFGPVEAGDAGEDLLRRIPPAADDDVVLPDRIREHSCYGFFDAFGIELEDSAGDRESRHTGICLL